MICKEINPSLEACLWLSIDIDLNYLPVQNRDFTGDEIDAAIKNEVRRHRFKGSGRWLWRAAARGRAPRPDILDLFGPLAVSASR